ncbi:MAG: hypothetical protein LBE75_08020, partial [Burkholderiales bacterium]|nr:hypothetical protein [Burkholderiales bacterium]
NQGVKTPEWAVEGKDKSGQHRNYYSIKAAKEAMFRAATLRTLESGQLKPLPTPDPSGFGTTGLQMGELFKVSESEELQRRAYWATVFKSLGHALHLLHDMGQPQHVRNDSHSGAFCIPDINGNISDRCAGGQDSFYEKYIEARVKGEGFFVLSKRFFERNEPGDVTSPTTESKPLTYVDSLNPYPMPSFNGYYDYYRSEGKTGSDSYSGMGLANYTNMGFYSAGTNLGAYSPYPYPPRDYNALTQHHILPEEVKGMSGELIKDNEAYVTLLRYPVLDRLAPGKTEPNVALTGYSVFDQFLRDKGKEPVYSLNHYNYDAKADLLLPRAVAYSAGLIDYFFRGRMEISLPKDGVYSVVDHAQFADTDPINDFKGFGKIKLKLKNTTKDVETASGESYPQTMSDGILVATLKFYRNKDYTDDLNGELSEGATLADAYRKGTDKEEMILSEPIALSGLAPGEDIELTFNFQKELPINAWTPVRLSVVFRGKLGDEEDAVIVSEKPISSPVFFAAYNELDYIDLNQTCYTREQIIGSDALWGLLRADCKKSLSPSEPREFSDMCKKDVMNVAIDFGGADSNLSIHWINEEGALQVRRFGRVAFLVDDEKTSLSVFAASYQGNYNPAVVSYENLADYYFVFSDYRGINVFGGNMFIMNGRSQFGGGVCTNGFMPGHPTLLQGEERKPVPATEIIGW